MKTAFTIVCVFLATSVGASAADWKLYGAAENKQHCFYDVESISVSLPRSPAGSDEMPGLLRSTRGGSIGAAIPFGEFGPQRIRILPLSFGLCQTIDKSGGLKCINR